MKIKAFFLWACAAIYLQFYYRYALLFSKYVTTRTSQGKKVKPGHYGKSISLLLRSIYKQQALKGLKKKWK